MGNIVTETRQITVDFKKATEKTYNVAITVDFSDLTPDDIQAYAYDGIVIQSVNPLRKKGHDAVKALNGTLHVKAKKPGTRVAVDPETAARNLSTDVLQKILAEKEAELKARVIVRPGGKPGHDAK